MAREKTQADFRKMHNATDIWGREYLVTIEIASGDPTGPINQNFTDPLNTPQKYIHIPRNAPYTAVTDYALWIAELKERGDEWESTFTEYCQSENMDADELLERGPRTARERAAFKFAGPRPQDWKKVEAASKGAKEYLYAADYKRPGPLAIEPVSGQVTTCGICATEYDDHGHCPACAARFKQSQQAARMRAAKGKKLPAASVA